MALPTNFSEATHLRNVIMRLHNKKVKNRYKDLGDDDWVRSIDTPRAEERTACMIQSDDSGVMIVQRLILYYFVLGHALDAFGSVFYSIPSLTFQETFIFAPQIVLHFKERDADANTHSRQPLKAQVAYRVRDSNITKADLQAIANEIKNEFATPRLVFAKGKIKYVYLDKAKGYDFRILAQNEADAMELITKTLKLQNDVPDWDNFSEATSKRNFAKDTVKTIVGKVVKLPKRRQLGNVRFTHAEFKQHGLIRDYILVDCLGRYPDALVKIH
jgi:hypothetical protein